MPSPERGPPGPDDQPRRPETESAAYQRASRFADEAPRLTDLSVYRFRLDRLWHVAALGLLPPRPVLHAIEAILGTDAPADLPPAVWRTLQERRAQATRQASWVERHHRPSERL
jgi:hypothetical protein